ncbi:MAG TPA: hypothetical protein VIS27_02990 [Yeosuana sp.]
MENKTYTYNELISVGFTVIDYGYDYLSNWIVVEMDGIRYYYYFDTKEIERIDERGIIWEDGNGY